MTLGTGDDRRRLTVRRIGEEVSADRAVEEAGCSVDDRMSIRIRRPGETNARGDVIVAGVDTTRRHAGIAREQNALVAVRGDRGRLVGHEVHRHVRCVRSGWSGCHTECRG